MRALKRIPEVPFHLDGSFESLLAQFSATTLELNPSLGTSEFARRLTARTAEMTGAHAVLLVLGRLSDWEIAGFSGRGHHWELAIQRRLAAALARNATGPGPALRTGTASSFLGPELAGTLGWGNLVVVRLTESEGAALGILCLVDIGRELSGIEKQLLEALAGHASVALENVRLFSRIERSRKQWVEDVDAISDLIVVHDADNRVLRLNRALADLLKVKPAEAVGRDMGKLELLGSSVQAGRCPFCRNPAALHEEFMFPAADRSYLVSASRIQSGHNDELRTIHVVKDISDRREAERPYRRERAYNK